MLGDVAACRRAASVLSADNKIIEQVNLFNSLGNMISYEGELDIDNKLNNFFKMTGILNNVFRQQKKTLRKTRIKLYNTLALPVLLHGSENWSIKASDTRRITAAVMKYMRRKAGYTWTDYKTNATNCKEVKYNTNFGQINGIKEKMDTTCK